MAQPSSVAVVAVASIAAAGISAATTSYLARGGAKELMSRFHYTQLPEPDYDEEDNEIVSSMIE